MGNDVLLVVEGRDDLEAVGRVLRHACGMKRVKQKQSLPVWAHRLAAGADPDDDLLRRPAVPGFFARDGQLVVAVVADGFDDVGKSLRATLANVGLQHFASIGVLVDMDDVERAARMKQVRDQFVPDEPGSFFMKFVDPGIQVGPDDRRHGVFLVPNDADTGCLETLLLAASDHSYLDLRQIATAFVDGLPARYRPPPDATRKREKTIVGTMVGVLSPCKSSQVSIVDEMWLTAKNLGGAVAPFSSFLQALVQPAPVGQLA